MNRWIFLFRRLSRQLWWRASLYAALGVIAALAGAWGAPFAPDVLAERFGGDSVEAVLTILASSLLAVATFSLGAMVTAYTSVSSAATPRAAALITGDESTQKALSTFVGAFLYAIVGVTAINAQYYGPGGRAIIFVFSLGVVALVAFRLLTWVSRLTSLARLSHTVERVEAEAAKALKADAERPRMGAASGTLSQGRIVAAASTGYVLNVDVQHLQTLAERADARVQILARPGAFRMRGEPLARLDGDKIAPDAVLSAFILGRERSFDQDPRYGLIVLGEIADKALSSAVNDIGTVVCVVGSGVRLLDQWADHRTEKVAECDRVLAEALDASELLDDIFGPVLRHGAHDLTAAIRLRKALASLSVHPVLAGPALAMDARLLQAAQPQNAADGALLRRCGLGETVRAD